MIVSPKKKEKESPLLDVAMFYESDCLGGFMSFSSFDRWSQIVLKLKWVKEHFTF